MWDTRIALRFVWLLAELTASDFCGPNLLHKLVLVPLKTAIVDSIFY